MFGHNDPVLIQRFNAAKLALQKSNLPNYAFTGITYSSKLMKDLRISAARVVTSVAGVEQAYKTGKISRDEIKRITAFIHRITNVVNTAEGTDINKFQSAVMALDIDQVKYLKKDSLKITAGAIGGFIGLALLTLLTLTAIATFMAFPPAGIAAFALGLSAYASAAIVGGSLAGSCFVTYKGLKMFKQGVQGEIYTAGDDVAYAAGKVMGYRMVDSSFK